MITPAATETCAMEPIKDEVRCYRPGRGPRLVTLTETLIISDSTKNESRSVFLYIVLVKKNGKHIVEHKCYV